MEQTFWKEEEMSLKVNMSHYICNKCHFVYTGVNFEGDIKYNVIGYDIPTDDTKGLSVDKGEVFCWCGGKAEPTGYEETRSYK
jgi:hypothetical protein